MPQQGPHALTFGVQFNFRNDQPGIVSKELVHFPDGSINRHGATNLFDDGLLAEFQQVVAIRGRDLVLELGACGARRQTLDREEGSSVGGAYPNGTLLVAAQISLVDASAAGFAPGAFVDEELALDLDAHVAESLLVTPQLQSL